MGVDLGNDDDLDGTPLRRRRQQTEQVVNAASFQPGLSVPHQIHQILLLPRGFLTVIRVSWQEVCSSGSRVPAMHSLAGTWIPVAVATP